MKIIINNQEYTALKTPCCYFLPFESESEKVNVKTPGCEWEVVRPLSLNISPDNIVMPTPGKIVLEREGDLPLFLFSYKKEEVSKQDYTHYFERGNHIYKEDIKLKTGDKVYIECGAVVQAHFLAENADDVEFSGRGIIDTSKIGSKKRRTMLFHKCKNLSLRDISVIGSIDWAVVPTSCEDVKVQDINIITWEVNGDGVDVVACKNVYVDGCFMHCFDDCIAVKATARDFESGANNSENLFFSNCTLWNARPGNVMEIGFECSCECIQNVHFTDITVLHSEFTTWQAGGVITIHNGDRATIRDVYYKNIVIEDASHKLFDFKVYHSQYTVDEEYGHIENIYISDIDVICEHMPASIFRDFYNGCRIKNIRVKNLRHKGAVKDSITAAHFIAESGSEVIFD